MSISSTGNTLYASSKEGYVDIIDFDKHKIIKILEVTHELITSINLFHDDFYLLMTD